MDTDETGLAPLREKYRAVLYVIFALFWISIAVFGIRRSQQLHLVGIPQLTQELRQLPRPEGSVLSGDISFVYKSSIMAVSQAYVSNRTISELAPYFQQMFPTQGWNAVRRREDSVYTEYQFCKGDLLASLTVANDLAWPGLSKFTVQVESGEMPFVECK